VRKTIIHLIACLLIVPAFSVAGLSESNIDDGFRLDKSGYVRQWLIVEPQTRPNRTEQADKDKWVTAKPQNIAVGAPGPFAGQWKYYFTDENIFMETSGKATVPSAARMCAAIDLQAPKDMQVNAILRLSGWVDFWINEDHLGKFHESPKTVTLSLKKGRNRFIAYQVNGGVRGVFFRLGFKILDQKDKIRIFLPGPLEDTQAFIKAETWLRSLLPVGRDRVRSAIGPPLPATIMIQEKTLTWPQTASEFTLPSTDVFAFTARIKVKGQVLERKFEIPSNRTIVKPDLAKDLQTHRREFIEKMMQLNKPGPALHQPSALYLFEGIARHTLGQPPIADAEIRRQALHKLDKHIADADFDMAFALRFYCLGAGTEKDREHIKKVALGFRYWEDEPGKDNLCFQSENHRILFHSAQYIAGNLWPDEIFTNSGNTGRRQAQIGRQRCLEWIKRKETYGFEEFLSTSYIPVTMAPVLNLVDFSPDPQISKRAAKLVDRMYEMLAEHAFDGVAIGPMGRTYRHIIYPQTTPSQSILSYATPKAVESLTPWPIFVASSPKYTPPAQIENLMKKPVSKQYMETYFDVHLVKTEDYMLSSVQIPAGLKLSPSAKDVPFIHGRLVPGGGGYQQHIWHATLARNCHVFTNCPGSTYEFSPVRPGFWYGNKFMPRQVQRDNMLLQIFSIPRDYHVEFTHAYWPSDAFDRQQVKGNWAFGQKNTGYIALWCSSKPEFHSAVLTNRELRAYGNRVSWVCICSGKSKFDNFDAFIRHCHGLKPEFDPERLKLSIEGSKPLYWDVERK